MAGTSALLKSAASRRAAIQNEKNRIADMEWQLSAKTEDDLALYIGHYSDAATKAAGSDRLTYLNKITSARRSFQSNEIQRASIRVLEGSGTNEDKLVTIENLYNQAVDNGDYDSAQNLRQQFDSLYKTVQSERQQAVNLATSAYNSGYTNVEKYVKDLVNGDASPFGEGGLTMKELGVRIRQVGPEGMGAEIDAMASELGIEGAPLEQVLLAFSENATAAAIANRDQYQPGTDEYMKLSNLVEQSKNETALKIPGPDGKMVSVSPEELRMGAMARQTNGTSMFRPTDNGFALNKVQRYEYGVDPATGEATMVPRYTTGNPNLYKTDTNLDRYGSTYGTGQSNVAAGMNGYNFVQVDLGDGRGVQSLAMKDGQLYELDMNGDQPKIGQKPVMSVEDVKKQNAQLEQQYLAPKKALEQYGYEFDDTGRILDEGAYREWQVDPETGRIQYKIERYDPTNPDASQQYSYDLKTIDLSTGRQALLSQETQKIALENKRLAGATNAQDLLMPAGASSMLQKAEGIQKLQKTAQVQQTASAQQISQMAAQPIKVMPLPAPTQPLKVTAAPKPASKVAVTPSAPKPALSVYEAPISAGAAPKVSVTASPTKNAKVVVR